MSIQQSDVGERRSLPVWLVFVALVSFGAGVGVGALLWRGQDVEQATAKADASADIVSGGYEAAGLLLKAADNLAKERGLTYTALKSEGHISESSGAEIVSARQAADQALTQALDVINNRLEFARDTTFMQRVSTQRQTVTALAKEITDAGTAATGDANLANRWFTESSRLLASIDQLVELVHARIRSRGVDINSDVALKLQRLAVVMADFAGRERAVVSGAIAENRPLDESFSRWVLPAYKARIKGIWDSISAIDSSSALAPDIKTIIDRVQQDYFGELEALRDAVQKASDAGDPYPITAEAWFAKSTAVIDSIISLGLEAGQQARGKMKEMRPTG